MNRTILLADSEPEVITTLANGLTQAGYRVLTTDNGAQAIALAASEKPDLVCLEVNLAGVNGLDACKRIKAQRAVPVVVTTARLDDTISAGYLSAGADDLLFKPYTLDEIIDKAEWYMSEAEA